MRNILAVSQSILSLEKHREQFELTLNQADVIMVTVDLDGVVFKHPDYDQEGRIIDESTESWTNPMITDELKILGASLQLLKTKCTEKGKRLIVALNTNREIGIAKKVFDGLPDDIAGHCLCSLEAGHVKAFLDKSGNMVAQSLPDSDAELSTLKKAVGHDFETAFSDGLFGKLAYKPFRQGMITYRNVDPEIVGWDEEAKTVSGPLLTILEKHGYPHNHHFKVVYYPFDGGLDIQFTKFSKQTGEVDLIDIATDLGLVASNDKVIQVHFGDTWSDALNGTGQTTKGIWYDVFTLAVANSQQRLLDHAKATTQSGGRWGIYEGIRLLEDMLTQTKPEKKLDLNGSVIKLLRSYLGPENPTPADFNLKEALANIDLEKAKNLIDKIKLTRNKNGRVFIIGNGGSYDNARLIALLLRQNGVNADVPGSGQKYLEAGLSVGHDHIFEKTLQEQGLNENDLLITISGSGNSPNILKAIEFAHKTKTQVFALGGRDGGKMSSLAGSENSFIARTPTMEIIEDVHAAFGYLVATSLNTPYDEISHKLNTQREKTKEIVNQLLETKNVQEMAKILLAVESTLITKGRIILIGDSIGVNHVRADMARGATNQLPFSFRIVENLGSTNSMLATQNDDGADFTLVHALENVRPEIGDVVIILNSPGRSQDRPLDLCYELAQDRKSQVFLIGDNLPDKTANVFTRGSQADYELMTTILADLSGRTLHEHLVESMEIKIAELDINLLPQNVSSWLRDHLRIDRKLGERETLEFESMLRKNSLLSDNKVVTFCYGKMFTVDSPEKFGLERSFY